MRLETARLVLDDVTADDVDALLAVALSNPAFLASHEGADGDPGRFDRAMVERDLTVAAMDPARHPLAVRRAGRVVGWAEVLDEHPVDGVPWVGLLELHADAQGDGLGGEAAQALVGWARASGASALRLGVDGPNARAHAFWQRQGFAYVETRERPSPLGRLPVDVLEHRL